jgi:hypothetical protein
MITSAWVGNTLDQLESTCINLLKEDANIISISLSEQNEHGYKMQLKVVVKRNDQEEGRNESTHRFD